MDADRVDLVLHFALAAAGQEDPGQQELGPIHLIKLVYLADLAYAERHGVTFTGTRWTFYKLGPWAGQVLDRIAPLAERAQAVRRSVQARIADAEGVRYKLVDEAAFTQLAGRLPGEIVSAVRWAIHEYGADTPGLLSYVYRTDPMVRAAPGESLQFEAIGVAEASPPYGKVEKTWKARKARKEAMAQARASIREKLAARRKERAAVVTIPPRYDEVFEEGTRWLDGLPGEPVSPLEADATFSEDIWKSPTRAGRDVP